MKISLLQSTLIWENPDANRAAFEKLIETIDKTDLIVLPEMFSTGFTMKPRRVAETMEGETVQWMQHVATARDCAVTGSLVIEEKGKYFNRLVFALPDGSMEIYDKRHLFSLAGEDKEYTAGGGRLVLNYRGWKICPLVCYDLRFPVYSRNTEGYDLLLYVANWPSSRIVAWDSLLKARAIENMCYVAGVNRIGVDENDNEYPGHSQVFDCLGSEVVEPSSSEGVFTLRLDKNHLEKTRKKLGFLEDRDSFTLHQD